MPFFANESLRVLISSLSVRFSFPPRRHARVSVLSPTSTPPEGACSILGTVQTLSFSWEIPSGASPAVGSAAHHKVVQFFWDWSDGTRGHSQGVRGSIPARRFVGLFCCGLTPSYAQGLLLVPCSGIVPGGLMGLHGL